MFKATYNGAKKYAFINVIWHIDLVFNWILLFSWFSDFILILLDTPLRRISWRPQDNSQTTKPEIRNERQSSTPTHPSIPGHAPWVATPPPMPYRITPIAPHPWHNYALECLIMMALGWQRWLRSRSVVCSLISATKTRRHLPAHTSAHTYTAAWHTLTHTHIVISVLQLLCPFMRDLSLTRKI